MREVEKLLDEYTERAARFYTTLETSADLAEHVRIIMGLSLIHIFLRLVRWRKR